MYRCQIVQRVRRALFVEEIDIRAEKEELIKQGKIKRDKKESVIFKGDDNSYYQDLPQNWQVSTLREITTPLTLNDGDWILSENMTDNGEVKLLQLGSIGNMSYIDRGFKYLTKETFDELSCTEIFTGYLIINRIISDKMCCCIVPDIDGTNIYAHLDYTSKLSSAKAMVSGMALPESVNFGSKWSEISNDGGKN